MRWVVPTEKDLDMEMDEVSFFDAPADRAEAILLNPEAVVP